MTYKYNKKGTTFLVGSHNHHLACQSSLSKSHWKHGNVFANSGRWGSPLAPDGLAARRGKAVKSLTKKSSSFWNANEQLGHIILGGKENNNKIKCMFLAVR